MRVKASSFAILAAATAFCLSAGKGAEAQSTASRTAGNGTYITVDPLALVRYDNRYDVSVGMAYDHM